MKFFSWKDIERYLMMHEFEWERIMYSFDASPDRIYIYPKTNVSVEDIEHVFQQIFPANFSVVDNGYILKLDIESDPIEIIIDDENTSAVNKSSVPLFKKVLYRTKAYPEENLEQLKCPVIAFHSYKGGVGRTLSLLAFAKAWSSVFEGNISRNRLLIVDADIEAPGLTWLNPSLSDDGFSYLDLLDVIQDYKNIPDMLAVIKNRIDGNMITIENSKQKTDHVFLPTYRYREQLLDLYASPESIVMRKNKRYILAEVLAEIGKSLGAAAVLVDLRAGISEFSSTLLFDQRVKKYIVTSTSTQSVRGTKLILDYLLKGMEVKEDSLLPEVFLGMIPNDLVDSKDIRDIKEDILSHYDSLSNQSAEEINLTDNVLTEVPFASELIHLTSLGQIFDKLKGRELFHKMVQLIQTNYIETDIEEKDVSVIDNLERVEVLKQICAKATEQITADTNDANFDMLMTDSLKNLMEIYRNSLPNTVIMGAKGSGKTFLYKKMIKSSNWKNFCMSLTPESPVTEIKAQFVPVLASKTFMGALLRDCIQAVNQAITAFDIKNAICNYNDEKLIDAKQQNFNESQWRDFWDKLLAQSLDQTAASLSEIDIKLKQKNEKLIFLIDGIEEIFTHVLTSEMEKLAVLSLCQTMVETIRARYSNLGIIVFMRHDMLRNAIRVNFAQFEQKYSKVQLKWSAEDALKLAVWLFKQSTTGLYTETIPVERASKEVIENYLKKLWGTKLGKANSNEAYTSRWILAALSDFYGQLQARDMIRFLKYATETRPPKVTYTDRFIMPTEIRNSVAKCSDDKLDEIKQEYPMLESVLKKMNELKDEIKKLPFTKEDINLTSEEENGLSQVGLLQKLDENYYIPEIIRHGLKFKYKKGARPKVLSLLLK